MEDKAKLLGGNAVKFFNLDMEKHCEEEIKEESN
jgi:uncharacterized protein YbjQ (UPF0145 family)